MIDVLISGKLRGTPTVRTATNGHPYALFKLARRFGFTVEQLKAFRDAPAQGGQIMSNFIRKLTVKKPENRAELALILMKAAMHFPGGLDVVVSLNFVRAITELGLPVPNLAAAPTAAGAALAACMPDGMLNDRPETGVVYPRLKPHKKTST